MTAPLPDLTLPAGAPATAPPEYRGLARDEVKLMVARPDGLHHDRFRRLADHLRPGDVVVVNTSATRVGAVDARWGDQPVVVHFSNRLDTGAWVVELRRRDGSGPVREAEPDQVVVLKGGGHLQLVAPYQGDRLWTVRLSGRGHFRHARPISYGYGRPWPLSEYQTIFARPDDPTGSSAEMPSAGRPFSHPMVTELITHGVGVFPVTLHTGVSSLERHEAPPPEWFRVPKPTARAVEGARAHGGRVVAVGTTVTRALESAVHADGRVAGTRGWTELVLNPGRPARVVTGLVTGWHPPDASHLLLLEAVATRPLIERAYRAAADNSYLWHEFGDACLLLP